MPEACIARGGQKMDLFTDSGDITASGSTHTKGSRVELVNTTAREYSALFLTARPPASAAASMLFDIDIGLPAGGSERTLLSNLLVSCGATQIPAIAMPLPIRIPKGVRLTAKVQSSVASLVLGLAAAGIRTSILQPFNGFSRADTIGANTGTSRGTSLDPGGTVGTYPASFTQLSASVSRAYRAVSIFCGDGVNSAMTTCTWTLQLAIGASSAERVIVDGYRFGCTTGEDTLIMPSVGPIFCYIPSGARLSARVKCTITDATDRLCDLVVVGYH